LILRYIQHGILCDCVTTVRDLERTLVKK